MFTAIRSSKRTKTSRGGRRWSAGVKTVSTYPPAGIFTRDAATIARVMASKRVSPKGIGSAIRMVEFFINRAGKELAPHRRAELERAKALLQRRSHGRTKRLWLHGTRCP